MLSRSAATKAEVRGDLLRARCLGDRLILALQAFLYIAGFDASALVGERCQQSSRTSETPFCRRLRFWIQSRKASRITSLLDAYSPVSIAWRTVAAIPGGGTMLIFSACLDSADLAALKKSLND
jgi:hypothetical protein